MRRHPTVARDRRRLPRRLASDSGLTLIELLVTMAILLTVVGALTGALVSATNTETDLNNRFQTQQQARQALTKLTREIHCAKTITDTNQNPLGATPVSAIVLTLPVGCQTGSATTVVTSLWCTVPDGNRFDLYRSITPSPCSASTGVRWATSLLDATPFSLPSVTTSGPHLPLVHIDLHVNTRIRGAFGKYKLVDDVAALNAGRS